MGRPPERAIRGAMNLQLYVHACQAGEPACTRTRWRARADSASPDMATLRSSRITR